MDAAANNNNAPFQSLLDKPMLLAGAGALLLMAGLFIGAFLVPLLQAALLVGGKSSNNKKKKKKRNKSKTAAAAAAADTIQQQQQQQQQTKEAAEAEVAAETETPPATTASKKKKKKKGGAAAAPVEAKPEPPAPEPETTAPAEDETPSAAATAPTASKKKKKKKKKAGDAANGAEGTAAPAKPKADNEDTDDDDDDLAVLLKNRKKPVAQTKANPNNTVQTAASTNAASNNANKPNNKPKEEAWVTVDKQRSKSDSIDEPELKDEDEDEEAAAAAADPNAIHTVNLQVTEAQKPVLLGPKGATIQSIQTECQVKLDLQVPVLKITGTEAAIAQAMEQVSAVLEKDSAQKAHSVTLTSKDINGADGVKAIIGKGGSTIQSIQSETGCQLDANVEQGKVVITGPTAEQVERASTLCQHAVFGEAQDVLELGTVSTVMLVLGKDYTKIRQMEQEAGEGCKLDIVKGTTTLKIRGPAEAVPKARSIVQAWLEYCKGETMNIEQSQVGAVYGKGGATIRKIQAETGAYVEIMDGANGSSSGEDSSKKSSSSSLVPCKIMGEPEAVQQAKAMVLKALDGEMVELQKGEIMELMDLDPYVVPSVIGRGGSKIRELQTQYGVQLQVTGTRLRLIGTKQKVSKAKTELDTKIIQPLMEEKRIAEEAERLEQEASKENGKGGGAWSSLAEIDDADGW